MGDYIDWSVRECDAECAAQVMQSSIEVAQSAQMATTYVGESLLALESVRTMIEEMHTLSDNTESQIILLRIETQKISDDIISISFSLCFITLTNSSSFKYTSFNSISFSGKEI